MKLLVDGRLPRSIRVCADNPVTPSDQGLDRGSDAVSLQQTTARRDGDSWFLDGHKKWIGIGTIADVVVVGARDTADGRVKGFLVEKGAPGFRARRIERSRS